MIRINLLPIRASRKREYVKQQLLLGLVLVIGTIVGVFIWHGAVSDSIDKTRKKIKEVEMEIERHKQLIGEVDKYKGMKAHFQKKLEIIAGLEKGKSGPVKALDRLSQIVPKEVWINSFEEKNGMVTLKGEALSNKHVASLITSLKTKTEWESDSDSSTGSDDAVLVPTPPSGGPGAAAKKPGQPGSGEVVSTGPARLFSEIELLESKAVEFKEVHQVFFSFKIRFRVNYAI